MTFTHTLVTTLLAVADAPAAQVPVTGRISGGWGYVWFAYGITWATLTLYGLSLWVRRPRQPLTKDERK